MNLLKAIFNSYFGDYNFIQIIDPTVMLVSGVVCFENLAVY